MPAHLMSHKAKDSAYITLSENQTTDLSAGNRIKFDTVTGNLTITSNRIALTGGKKYRLLCNGVFANGDTNAAYLDCQWYDYTNAALLGKASSSLNAAYTNNVCSQPSTQAVVSPVTDIEVELRITASDITTIHAGQTSAYIEEI